VPVAKNESSGNREMVTCRVSCLVLNIIEQAMKSRDMSKTAVVEEAIRAYWGQGHNTIAAAENDPEAIAELVRRLRPADEATHALGSHGTPPPYGADEASTDAETHQKKAKRESRRQ
jgi:hypothetical protein